MTHGLRTLHLVCCLPSLDATPSDATHSPGHDSPFNRCNSIKEIFYLRFYLLNALFHPLVTRYPFGSPARGSFPIPPEASFAAPSNLRNKSGVIRPLQTHASPARPILLLGLACIISTPILSHRSRQKTQRAAWRGRKSCVRTSDTRQCCPDTHHRKSLVSQPPEKNSNFSLLRLSRLDSRCRMPEDKRPVEPASNRRGSPQEAGLRHAQRTRTRVRSNWQETPHWQR